MKRYILACTILVGSFSFPYDCSAGPTNGSYPTPSPSPASKQARVRDTYYDKTSEQRGSLQLPEKYGDQYAFADDDLTPVPLDKSIPAQLTFTEIKVNELPELVDEALRRNPLTHQAWETANTQAYALLASKSQFYPTLTINGTATPEYSSALSSKDNDYHRQGIAKYGPQAKLSWTLFDFGGRSANIRAARLNLLASEFGIDQNLQVVALTVIKNYYAYCSACWSIAFLDEQQKILGGVDAQKNAVDEADKRFGIEIESLRLQASLPLPIPAYHSLFALSAPVQDLIPKKQLGRIEGLEIARNKAKVSQAAFVQLLSFSDYKSQYAKSVAREIQANARAQLLASIGVSATDKVKIDVGAIPMDLDPGVIPEKSEPALILYALNHRPDVANAYALSLAAAEKVTAAQSNIYPSMSLSLTAGPTEGQTWDKALMAHTTHSIGRSDDVTAQFTISMTAFDGGNLYNLYQAAKAAAASSSANLDNSRLSAIADVAVSFQTYKYSVEQMKLLYQMNDAAKGEIQNAKDLKAKLAKDLANGVTTVDQEEEKQSASVTIAKATDDATTVSQALPQAVSLVYVSAFALENSLGRLRLYVDGGGSDGRSIGTPGTGIASVSKGASDRTKKQNMSK
ncbi:MAG: TolC family protein [Chthoniobacteraceae bacterium]